VNGLSALIFFMSLWSISRDLLPDYFNVGVGKHAGSRHLGLPKEIRRELCLVRELDGESACGLFRPAVTCFKGCGGQYSSRKQHYERPIHGVASLGHGQSPSGQLGSPWLTGGLVLE
jgi:hypothetical protein